MSTSTVISTTVAVPYQPGPTTTTPYQPGPTTSVPYQQGSTTTSTWASPSTTSTWSVTPLNNDPLSLFGVIELLRALFMEFVHEMRNLLIEVRAAADDLRSARGNAGTTTQQYAYTTNYASGDTTTAVYNASTSTWSPITGNGITQ